MTDAPPPAPDAPAHAARMFEGGALAARLGRLIAIDTDSTAGPDGPGLAPYLDLMGDWLSAAGFDLHRPVCAGWPFLVARRNEDPARPTLLFYGHGDTVPAMAGRWHAARAPLALTEADGRWYGRGIADNKGQHLIVLSAMEAVIAARGALGFNAVVLIEMGEEAGSPGLEALARARPDLLAADLFLGCDGPRVAAEVPTLFCGGRGGLTVTLKAAPRAGGRHSGNFGGLLANPGTRLAHAIAAMIGPDGAIRVPGWQVPPPDAATRAALAGIVPAAGEIDPGWGSPGLSPAERVHAANALEVLAFDCGNPAAPVNAIPPAAQATLQLRFVSGTETAALIPRLRAFLDAEGFADIAVDRAGAGFPASATPLSHPWPRRVRQALAEVTGRSPAALPSLGGSIPNHVFRDILGLPTVWVPHSYPGCSQHAPDEHLPVALVRDALLTMAGLLERLGRDLPGDWPRDCPEAGLPEARAHDEGAPPDAPPTRP